MGTSILKGITTGLLVTVITLLAVLGTTLAGFEKNIIAYIVDFGILLSCLAAGYRASRNSGRILAAGVASGGYAVVGVLLLALYFPIDLLGAAKIISEGIGLGLLAGVLGTGVLNSDPDPYQYMEVPYPKRGDFYERKDIYEMIGEGRQDKSNPVSISYGKTVQIPEYMENSAMSRHNKDTDRARIYEILSPQAEQREEDEAFNWWEVEAKKQLKSR